MVENVVETAIKLLSDQTCETCKYVSTDSKYMVGVGELCCMNSKHHYYNRKGAPLPDSLTCDRWQEHN